MTIHYWVVKGQASVNVYLSHNERVLSVETSYYSLSGLCGTFKNPGNFPVVCRTLEQ